MKVTHSGEDSFLCLCVRASMNQQEIIWDNITYSIVSVLLRKQTEHFLLYDLSVSAHTHCGSTSLDKFTSQEVSPPRRQ